MPKTSPVVNPAERLVKALGGRPAVAEEFDVSTESVRLWERGGIPTDRALDVEEKTKRTKDPISAREVLEYARKQKAAA